MDNKYMDIGEWRILLNSGDVFHLNCLEGKVFPSNSFNYDNHSFHDACVRMEIPLMVRDIANAIKGRTISKEKV